MDILDAFLSSLDKFSLGSLVRLDNTEASLIKVDNTGSKFGFINCDQFMLQVVISERRNGELLSFNQPKDQNFGDEVEPPTESNSDHKQITNLRIEPVLVFTAPGEKDPLTMQLDPKHFIHFMRAREQRSIDVDSGRASVRLKANRLGVSLDESRLILVDSAPEDIEKSSIFDGLPLTKFLEIFRVRNKILLHVKVKQNINLKLGDAIIRFDKSQFSSVSCLMLVRDGVASRQETHLFGVY